MQSANPSMLTNGLVLWFKADAGVTQSGGSVSAWADQTGNYPVTQSASGNQPTYVGNDVNGQPALRFNRSQWLYNPSNINLNADMTIVRVASTTNASIQEYVVGLGSAPYQSRASGYNSGAQNFDFYDVGTDGIAETTNFVTEIYTLNSSRTGVTFYRNGIQTATAAVSGIQNVNSGIDIGAFLGGSYGWQGDISEVLVYDHELNSTELTQVDGYLADKYGLYDPNATWPLAYSSDVQAEITRNQWNKAQADNYVAMQSANPSMLTNGLVLWFKADAGVTQSGGSVSAWADQTGNYPVTQSTGASQPLYVASDSNGEPALRFGGSSFLQNALNMGAGMNADITLIYVGMTTSPSSTTEHFAAFLGGNSTGTRRGVGYTSGLQFFEVAGMAAEPGPAPPANTFVTDIATLNSARTGVTFYRNGSQIATGTVSGVQNMAPGVLIGWTWQGDIAEVLAYNHQLSSAELAQVDGYLADKYGLYDPNATWPLAYSSDVQTEITLHQWNKAEADNYVAMQSANPTMLTNGLVLWLKADAGVTQSSGNVSAWADQTGNYPVAGSGSGEPTYVSSDVNGKPALRFNGSQFLANASNLGLNADMTMISVAMTSVPGTQQYTIYLGNGTAHQTRGIGYISGQELYNTSSGYSANGEAPLANNFIAEAATLDGTLSTVTFYQNGVTTGTGTLSSVGNLSQGITIGAAENASLGWQGDIAEVLVYDHELSSTELQQVSAYLADKYGLYAPNATWPLAYSSDVQTEITLHQWNKTQADNYVAMQSANPTMLTNGLVLWLKADAGVTQSSGNVSAWADQTGNYPVSQSTSANQPTYVSNDVNGEPAMRFNGSQGLSNPANLHLNADMTVIAVSMTTSPGSQQYSVALGNETSYQNRGVGYYQGCDLFDTTAEFTKVGSAPAANTFVAEAATLNSGLSGVTFYRNGASLGTGSLSGVQNLSAGIAIGSSWQGDIAEILVYDHKLTSTELQQVSVYLANKYGLPYDGFGAPVISPAGGSYTGSQTVTITGPDSPAVIKYTLDGSEPTIYSSTYTGTFTLTGSALVQATVFLSGQISSPIASEQFYVNDSGSTGLPTVPTSLSETVISGHEIDLAWTLSGQLNYSEVNVYRSSDGGTTYQLIASLDPTATFYHDTSATSGASYQYFVGTLNSAGESDTTASSSVTAGTPSTMTISVSAPSGATSLL